MLSYIRNLLCSKEDYKAEGDKKMKKELKKARSWYGNWIMKYIDRLY